MNRFLVMIKGKVNIGSVLYFEQNLRVEVLVINEDGTRVVKFFQNEKQLDFLELIDLLNSIGHLPLPHYMNREDVQKDNEDYHTLFAKNY